MPSPFIWDSSVKEQPSWNFCAVASDEFSYNPNSKDMYSECVDRVLLFSEMLDLLSMRYTVDSHMCNKFDASRIHQVYSTCHYTAYVHIFLSRKSQTEV